MKFEFDRVARQRRCLLCASTAVALLTAIPAAAQTADSDPPAAQPQADQTPDQPQDGQASGGDIVVTGIRASIARAADIKRNSNQIVDAISSEDIGKLPDTNIAEGLQRITGVQIQRSGGEGNGFQIRGATQNLTLVNGREVAPDADTASTPNPVRQVNLFNYPSELFSEILVYKSPAASQIEGGVGGTVDLRMPDPLRAPQRIAAEVQGGQLSLQDKKEYGASFILSRRPTDNLGIVLGITYFKRDVTTDAYSGSGYSLVNTLDVTGDGVADPKVAVPLNLSYNRELNVRGRLTVNGLVAWEPTDTIRGYVEGSWIKQTNDRRRSFNSFNFSTAQSPSPAAAATTKVESDGTTTVLAGNFRNVVNSIDSLNQSDDRNLFSFATGAVWKATDRLTVKAEAGRSWSTVNQFANILATQGFTNPVVAFDIRPDVPVASVVSGGSITDPATYRAATVNVRNTRYDPTLTQVRVDLDYDLNGFLDKIAIGGRLTRSFFDAKVLNNRYANTFPIGTNIPITRFPEYIQLRTLDNFLGGAGSGLPVSFIVTSIPEGSDAGADLLKKFGDSGVLRPTPDANYDIVEKTKAAYVQLDFGGEQSGLPIAGNIGVRYVRTELTSDGNAVGSNGTITPVSYQNNYGDWLPSFNIKWDAAKNLVVRGSVAKVVARPAITALTAGTIISFSTGALNTATSGQPLLKPFRATQYDFGVEYYFDGGGYLSGALFYKDIKSYVTQTSIANVALPGFPGQTFILTAPSNGPGGRSRGFEVGVQRSFGFISDALKDFGIIANYTFVDSKRRGSNLQIENTSRNSYNLIGYFESGPFQIRAAYNWRSSQYLGLTRGFNIYANARGQLDGSMSFDLSENVSLTLEGSNLLESPQTSYSEYPSRVDGYTVNDRSVLFGVRVKF
jgi:TonB-dependent receptor